MGVNKLRAIFNPTAEEQRRHEENLTRVEQELIDSHSCLYCRHAELRDHYMHGCYAGVDTYCKMDGRLKVGCQDCLFWDFSRNI